jgi:hypothetical protein
MSITIAVVIVLLIERFCIFFILLYANLTKIVSLCPFTLIFFP